MDLWDALARLAESEQDWVEVESLGGGWPEDPSRGGGGCEFGFVQRRLGAEPLSLLRWASIQPPDLLRGISEGFQALGEDETFDLRHQGHYDWQVREHRYKIQIDHTHLDRDKVTIEQARKMVLTRFRFLRSKLVEDLTLGEKIFLYRLADTNVASEEIEGLGRAVNQYGRNTLVFVMRSPAQSENVRVVRQREGLIVATLAPAPELSMGIKYDAWLELCRFAHAAVKGEMA